MGAPDVEFSCAVMAKKGIVYAVNTLAGWLIAHYGFALSADQEAALIIGICSGLTMLRNFLKIKYPAKFSWL